ncbi:predicted protein [Botrytis cinerea T4]|uniref:Uncharacterized protein n=1 Tax=Botryotinia fuckeliana (strain T4) TaxID=999810 RepID=G2YE49_BOTF4|nr:predicted protein [Botrytis cinerea T4]
MFGEGTNMTNSFDRPFCLLISCSEYLIIRKNDLIRLFISLADTEI